MTDQQSNPDIQPDTIISSTNKQYDAAQIAYGLELRGVRVRTVYDPGNKNGIYQILLVSPTEIQRRIAQESIEPIWDAILEDYPRAITAEGYCNFCQYDVSSLPKPTTCPECGVNVDSIEARRAMRDGKRV